MRFNTLSRGWATEYLSSRTNVVVPSRSDSRYLIRDRSGLPVRLWPSTVHNLGESQEVTTQLIRRRRQPAAMISSKVSPSKSGASFELTGTRFEAGWIWGQFLTLV